MERPRPRLGTQEDATVSRILAFVVDAILLAVVIGFLVGIFTALLGRSAVFITPLFGLAAFIYFIYMEGTYGQTIGKRLFGVVVVTESGRDCDMKASAIRNVLRIVDALPTLYIVGLAVMFLVSDKRQRVGDILADTIVVKAA